MTGRILKQHPKTDQSKLSLVEVDSMLKNHVRSSSGFQGKPYTYYAVVTDVYDGDTITVDIDLGFDQWLVNQKIRIHGINAYEVRLNKRKKIGIAHKNKGLRAKALVSALILTKKILITTDISELTNSKGNKKHRGKYGRLLAHVFYTIHDNTEGKKLGDDHYSIADLLLDNNLAKVAKY